MRLVLAALSRPVTADLQAQFQTAAMLQGARRVAANRPVQVEGARPVAARQAASRYEASLDNIAAGGDVRPFLDEVAR